MVCARAPLADYAQSAHLPSHRRHRRGGDHLAARATRWNAQLGLSLLLAQGCNLHLVESDEQRRLRRGAGLARMAGACRRRQPGAVADHVRHRRRAAADRIGTAVVAGLSRREAGADRQCRVRPIAARRLRRGHGRALSGAPRRVRPARRRHGPAARHARPPREDLARAGRGDLGSSGRPPALHLLQGHGVGGFRPRRQVGRGVQTRGPDRPLEGAAAGDSR